jgi:hypothetical protein
MQPDPRRIQIHTDIGPWWCEAERTFGHRGEEWAVTPAVCCPAPWTVTHVRTGRAIDVYADTPDLAEAAARARIDAHDAAGWAAAMARWPDVGAATPQATAASGDDR